MKNISRNLNQTVKTFGLTFVLLLCCTCYSPRAACAGEWRVSPIRLELGSAARSGVISVINEGTGRFQVQMKAFRWEQDADGKDQYTESNDLIFFPKIMIFNKTEERILRAGIKIPAGAKEKTYRLFVEEIPEPKKAEGANIAVAIRFGVPIFVKPMKEEFKGEITKLELIKDECRVTVKNSGNVHFVINSIDIKGKNLKGEETFAKKLGGWYLLNGASRVYSAAIPKEVCTGTAKLDVEVKTDHFTLHGKLDVDKSMCQ
ncbi:MAG: fimbria/pilus periplasmic chaperone [Desulfuromonadaceae bacterium]|nr:fimbria/pilus periplasmic chaperone [Desulfuromonadaceae bacterium]